MRQRVKSRQLKKFSDRLTSLYSNWKKHLSRQWKDANAVVVCTPSSPIYNTDPDLDSIKFFKWLFGDWMSSTYIVFSPTQIYAVCSNSLWYGAYEAEILRSFADEAKRTVGVDFVVKDRGSGRTLKRTLVGIVNAVREQAQPSGVKKKRKIAVGFIGEVMPVDEPTKLMEWKDVTDGFYALARIK